MKTEQFRVLMIHNYYQQWGGEDASTEQEINLLRTYGHKVLLYSRHNDEIKSYSLWRKGLLFFETTWSWRSYREVKRIVQEYKPDIAHFQNFFPLVSPSAIYACQESGVPVVQSLRDYRLLCPTGWFFRNNGICEECRSSLWRGVKFGCYHSSHLQTMCIALMLKVHRLLKTWSRMVDAYIALTEFSRNKFIEGGLPESKIFIRPNFLSNIPEVRKVTGRCALFVGRLSPEKGLDTLLEAWRKLPAVPLKIVGQGPLYKWIQEFTERFALNQIEISGFLSQEKVLNCLSEAFFLIVPSRWYEGFPRVILEAYALGVPVIASNLGSMAELVRDNETGLLFKAGDSEDLASKVKLAIESPTDLARWGRRAQEIFREQYTADAAYKRLIDIYKKVSQQ